MTQQAHALISGKYVIPTAPLKRFHEFVQGWIALNISGAFIWGLPRQGKTWMARALDSALFTRDGSAIRALFVPAATLMQTDRKFWGQFLTAWNISFRTAATAGQLMAAVVGELRERALENAAQTVILVIDEAQKLKRMHYSLLLDLTNILEASGVRIIVISVGSIELPDVAQDYFESKKDAQYRSRFFAERMKVVGLRGQNEVRDALDFYDTRQSPDTPCFTETYLPSSYANGFRLANFAKPLWAAYLREFPDARRTGWGMKFFHTAMLILLTDLPAGTSTLGQEQITLAVQHCGQTHAIDDEEEEHDPA